MPDPTLQATALRYAAGDLTASEAAAFEARLATDQDARDALAEAVRLSAAAVGQPPPAPRPSLRALVRARLRPHGSRGHPLAWVGLGAVAVAACTLVGLSLADRAGPPAAPAFIQAPPAPDATPAPREAGPAASEAPREQGVVAAGENAAASECDGGESPGTVAEIWAGLSTHDRVEKARDDELRWRQRVRDLMNPPHAVGTADDRTP
jgi:hypothetical protein